MLRYIVAPAAVDRSPPRRDQPHLVPHDAHGSRGSDRRGDRPEPEGDGGVPGPAPGVLRPRPAAPRPVRAVARPDGDARFRRQLLPRRPAGGGEDQGTDPDHADDQRPVDGAHLPGGHPRRDLLGGAQGVPLRPDLHGGRLHRVRHPHLLARPAADDPLRGEAGLAPDLRDLVAGLRVARRRSGRSPTGRTISCSPCCWRGSGGWRGCRGTCGRTCSR